MSDTIESFVAKLQAEGVDAGQQEAAKLIEDAKAQAAKIIADAEAQAKKTADNADAQAQATLERGKTELKLAARDIALKLQETLAQGLEAAIRQAVDSSLNDTAFVGSLLHEIVITYAKDLHQHKDVMTINVPEGKRQQLKDWALAEIGQQAVDGVRGVFNLRTTLAEAGFEYTVSGRTVEVTTSSVTTALAELLTPALREMLTEAMQDKAEG
jgi:vacuolar-type H+-ATPase subunit E/Vma4